MFFQSFSPVLDGKVISLAVLSVALFVTNSVTIYLAKRELEKIRTDTDSNTSNLVSVTNDLRNVVEVAKRLVSESSVQSGYAAENNLHLKRAIEQLDNINAQVIILATSQLKQSESTQRVIESLIDALGDH